MKYWDTNKINIQKLLLALFILFPFKYVLADETNDIPPAEVIEPSTNQNNPIKDVRILSDEDIMRYKDIKSLQTEGLWKEADKIISELENDILMGHVEFQKLMHPKKYRSSFSELSGWLAEYRDHPGAYRVYRLARKRQGKSKAPRRPMPAVKESNPLAKPQTPPKPQPKPVIVEPQYTRDERKEIARVKARIDRYIQRGEPERAEKRLWAFEKRNILSNADFDDELSIVAYSYFFEGKDTKAFSLASFAANRSRDHFSQGDWVSGLTAWRLGDCDLASQHFQAVANSEFAGDWVKAGGYFWAARSEMRCQRPENVGPLLQKSLNYPDTFYGLLSARQLGVTPTFKWELPELDEEGFNELLALPGVRRAIALDQIGDDVTADTELRLVWSRRQTQRRDSVIALAANLNLPASQALISRGAPNAFELPHSVLYPIPDWEPKGGFLIDKALLFAIMRQESYFRPTAQSGVGAMGLLQLMPDTASYIAKDRSLRRSNKSTLLQPEVNMSIGQKYMIYLLESNLTEGNLFKFATAYNGGPGNMSKWQDNTNYLGDPLFYIESLPARETRNFIERVFSNLWIYRSRLGQKSPSLDAIASGAWPPYENNELPNQLQVSTSASSQK